MNEPSGPADYGVSSYETQQPEPRNAKQSLSLGRSAGIVSTAALQKHIWDCK
jgi:hypothetical protein